MKWNFTYDQDYFDGEEHWCWEEYSFLTFTRHWGIPGLICCKYDGIPYKVLSFGFFSINWGRAGAWVLSEDVGR